MSSQYRLKIIFNLPTVLPRLPSTRESSVPIFVVQGGFARRNFKIVASILHVQRPFLIRIVGNGAITPMLASILTDARVECKVGLRFDAYHAQFQDAHAILPCVSRTTHPKYYTTKLTSSVSYAVGYDLHIVCDRPPPAGTCHEVLREPMNQMLYGAFDRVAAAFPGAVNGSRLSIPHLASKTVTDPGARNATLDHARLARLGAALWPWFAASCPMLGGITYGWEHRNATLAKNIEMQIGALWGAGQCAVAPSDALNLALRMSTSASQTSAIWLAPLPRWAL